jgi:diguanylate cyclase (GGDEF)-like protein/PAS domain S-box-containing protein
MDIKPCADRFGQLLTLQEGVDAITEEPAVADFLRRALTGAAVDGKGPERLCVCLSGALYPREEALEEACRSFAAASDDPSRIDAALLESAPDFELIAIATSRRVYGFFALERSAASAPESGRDYVRAVARLTALSLEARDRVKELTDAGRQIETCVAERQKTLSTLQDAQSRHRDVLEIGELGVWDWEPVGETYHWSDSLSRIFGRTLNRPPPEFSEFLTYVHPEDRKSVRDYFAASQRSETPLPTDYRIIRHDGEERVLRARTRAYRNSAGKLTRVAGTVQDVTGFINQQRLLESQALYARNLVEANLDPLLVIGSGGRIEDVNEAAARLFQTSRDKIIGVSFARLFDESEHVADGLRIAQAADHVTNFPLVIRRPSGDMTHLQMNACTHRAQKGEKSGVIASLRDVTQARLREEALAKYPDEMAATVFELRQRERDSAIIEELNQTLQTCNTQEEAYPLIAVAGEKLFPWASGALALFINPAQELGCVIKWGGAPHILSDFVLDDCWALRRGQLHQLDRPDKGAVCRHFDDAPGGPYMCLPLSVHGEAIGLLHLSANDAYRITDSVRRSFVTLGDMVKISLSNLKLRETLRFQAIRDPLTNLYNRQYLGETLAREVHRARRHQLPLSVAMLDIDFFKLFNDEHGHDAGDAVLREVGSLLRSSVRTSDIACRYGGEEFLFVLPECDLLAARARVEQICQEIKRRQCVFHGRRLPNITISAGIAQLSEEMNNEGELIEAADRALYAAKGAGRDRIGM